MTVPTHTPASPTLGSLTDWLALQPRLAVIVILGVASWLATVLGVSGLAVILG